MPTNSGSGPAPYRYSRPAVLAFCDRGLRQFRRIVEPPPAPAGAGLRPSGGSFGYRRARENRVSAQGQIRARCGVAVISEATKAFVEGVAAEAQRFETPCGEGRLVWHVWGSGPPLVLLHGGYGSWTHWIRNVLPLSRAFTVAAPDLPGLGESATPPEPHTAEGLARIIIEGLKGVFPKHAGLHIAGFSFGGVLGGHVAAQLGDRVRAFTIVGSNCLGLVRQPTDLRRVREHASAAETIAVARHDL